MTIQKIGFGILQEHIPSSCRCVLLYDEKIDERHLAPLKRACAHAIPLPGGEGVKSRAAVEACQDSLLAHGFGKDTYLIACGGGATVDLAGFIASTYCRGIRLCLIPSTLLAMCDASIGGKNGINVGGIKNIVGTVYPPELVITDLALLEGLQESEFKNGLVEMAKHALLDSEVTLDRFEKRLEKLITRAPKVLQEELELSIEIKKRYVSTQRDMLNFGHTIGHALEALEQFRCTHGQAVAFGMMQESSIAHQMGQLSKKEFERVERLMHALDLPACTPTYSDEEWLTVLRKDKKATREEVHFVCLQAIGKAALKPLPLEYVCYINPSQK